jgi:hypothetical protein
VDTTALHCTSQHCTALHLTALHLTALHCTNNVQHLVTRYLDECGSSGPPPQPRLLVLLLSLNTALSSIETLLFHYKSSLPLLHPAFATGGLSPAGRETSNGQDLHRAPDPPEWRPDKDLGVHTLLCGVRHAGEGLRAACGD